MQRNGCQNGTCSLVERRHPRRTLLKPSDPSAIAARTRSLEWDNFGNAPVYQTFDFKYLATMTTRLRKGRLLFAAMFRLKIIQQQKF